MKERPRLFVDMDGVLARFDFVPTERLYEEGYFRNRPPMEHMVEAVREVTRAEDGPEVYILSAVLTDSEYALEEKNLWLDRHLPELDPGHRIFVPCGEDKKTYIPEGQRAGDILLDDFTHNLKQWEPGRGIKLLNGINHTRGTWQGDMLRASKPADLLARDLLDVTRGYMNVRDPKLEQPPAATETGVDRFTDGTRFWNSSQIRRDMMEHRMYLNESLGELWRELEQEDRPKAQEELQDQILRLELEKETVRPQDFAFWAEPHEKERRLWLVNEAGETKEIPAGAVEKPLRLRETVAIPPEEWNSFRELEDMEEMETRLTELKLKNLRDRYFNLPTIIQQVSVRIYDLERRNNSLMKAWERTSSEWYSQDQRLKELPQEALDHLTTAYSRAQTTCMDVLRQTVRSLRDAGTVTDEAIYHALQPGLDREGFALSQTAERIVGTTVEDAFPGEDAKGRFEFAGGPEITRYLEAYHFGECRYDMDGNDEHLSSYELDPGDPEYLAYRKVLFHSTVDGVLHRNFPHDPFEAVRRLAHIHELEIPGAAPPEGPVTMGEHYKEFPQMTEEPEAGLPARAQERWGERYEVRIPAAPPEDYDRIEVFRPKQPGLRQKMMEHLQPERKVERLKDEIRQLLRTEAQLAEQNRQVGEAVDIRSMEIEGMSDTYFEARKEIVGAYACDQLLREELGDLLEEAGQDAATLTVRSLRGHLESAFSWLLPECEPVAEPVPEAEPVMVPEL